MRAPKAAGVTTNVTVHAGAPSEYSFTLSQTSAPIGAVVFTVVNDGKVTHDFSIAGQTTPNLSPGSQATLTVNFSTAGAQPYLCAVPAHADLGMQGNFTVTGTSTVKPAASLKATLKDFKIILTSRTGARVRSVKHGLIRVTVRNAGPSPHNLVFRGRGGTKVLKRGQRAVLDVVLKKAGRYYYFCSVAGHARLGMKGYLRVT